MIEEKVDILMATYNGEKYVKAQIESILNQTHRDFCLYICDDCSTDTTVEIVEAYLKKDHRVKLLVNNKNIGSTKTFEKLITCVKNKYYMFCDQDDIWNKNKVELSLKKMLLDDADLVFTDLEVVDENLCTLYKSFNKLKGYDKKIKKCYGTNMIYLYNVITGCTILSKSSYIEKILPLPENKDFIHDHYIPIVVSLNGKLSYLDCSTIKYRQHQNNQIGTKRYVDRFNEFDDVRNHLIDVKISIFKEYIKMGKKFDEKYQKLNIKALKYFINLKNKRNFNLLGINIFCELHKNEKLSYWIRNFLIFNVPFIVRIAYNFRKNIKEKCGVV